MNSNESQHLEIVAGPNGSGKSTFAQSYLVRVLGRTTYLNPDIIVSGVSPTNSPKASFHAGRIFLTELKDRIRKHEFVGFETTLSGLTYVKLLESARASGYRITIYFLFTKSSRINIARIKKRVAMGGHNIPTKDVLRRFKRSFFNFWMHYKDLADEWIIFDNSDVKPKVISNREMHLHLPPAEALAFETKFLKAKF